MTKHHTCAYDTRKNAKNQPSQNFLAFYFHLATIQISEHKTKEYKKKKLAIATLGLATAIIPAVAQTSSNNKESADSTKKVVQTELQHYKSAQDSAFAEYKKNNSIAWQEFKSKEDSSFNAFKKSQEAFLKDFNESWDAFFKRFRESPDTEAEKFRNEAQKFLKNAKKR